ncbi:MAG: bifunctional diaminohydroxyphosphoribosylaminopyrimidine deaminase/5-amino-6-(5-phosphoribosylamino)uracil reductase RibD [Rhodospirillaceae bacterium]|nr:bifunctional diaminohydroxyphosphoribosylaminopyrimidine deaminase/5-amino-6-(5-phosphoribosylamino)uracil reductase RibD [Rhodospirillaceae bacterium]
MRAALMLAARGLGDTWPNPAVGCIIVKEGMVVGRGWTQSGGRPHAETEALKRAGAAAKGATAYVSLEPCSHHGKTPPCAEALIAAGIARVVSATTDPDPRVSGQGVAKLRAAGIDVTEGVGKAEAEALNAGFFTRVTQNHPLLALKTATSLDGRIALASGESRWITGERARATVHAIRARFDAILVGSETAVQDDPDLTCRIEGYAGRPKVRIVLDRRLRLRPALKLAQTAKAIPTWIYTSHSAPAPDREALAKTGAVVIPVPDTAAALADMAARGLTRVLVEGGGQVAAALLKAGFISQVYWFRGAQALGAEARPAIGALALDQLALAPQFKRLETLPLGGDTLEILST